MKHQIPEGQWIEEFKVGTRIIKKDDNAFEMMREYNFSKKPKKKNILSRLLSK